jgi:hypothetical protein
MIVFATNLRPSDLVDEAFLRRIHYKVFAQSPTPDEYKQIFKNCCVEQGVEYRADVVDGLLASYYRPRQVPLRACHPRDLLNQAVALAVYRREPFEVSSELLEAACGSYFVDERSDAPDLQPHS